MLYDDNRRAHAKHTSTNHTGHDRVGVIREMLSVLSVRGPLIDRLGGVDEETPLLRVPFL